ncbi:MAG: topoisomerase DNA-binding C4 zinc finger domain-containing protein [Candidatus Dormibacteraeota bacterium]|nr:topoisomerase DNA-binding C4 zinc finger domain-containing protein [Candidatus Dormibacteraeota bacterium]
MSDSAPVQEGLLRALANAYADFLRRQRASSSALMTWPSGKARTSLDFAWLEGPAFREERLMRSLETVRVGDGDALLRPLGRMNATVSLNPYERETLYGYPFVVGRIGERRIRAPLLLLPLRIVPKGRGFELEPADDHLEFNSLPFLSEAETDARDLAITRIVQSLPTCPLSYAALRGFIDVLQRELPDVRVEAKLDGRFGDPPEAPPAGQGLSIIDQGAVLVAPTAAYFLASDLERLAAQQDIESAALAALLYGAGDEEQVDLTAERVASAKVYYPFPSNQSQRRVAVLVDDPTTRVVRVDGPPGTGKSLTIANLVCHLVATGRTVLVTSQKDKALQVVDEKLRELDSPLLPLTLLRRDRKPLLDRLSEIAKTRSLQEVESEVNGLDTAYSNSSAELLATERRFESALEAEAMVVAADRDRAAATGLSALFKGFATRRVQRRAKRLAPQDTAELSQHATRQRQDLLRLCRARLLTGAERCTARETRGQRQVREELAKVIRRDPNSYRNFAFFDRLKADVPRAEALLKSLPAWVMAPDDAARLFPCKEGLFDVVIVDEASQVDLPSITPVLHRAKKVAVFGDARQMQPRRFAFVSTTLAQSVWSRYGVARYDPDGMLHPTKQSLLDLASSRAEEVWMLDEHFRSLPSIIEFSNERWYASRLRVMTDETRKRFGRPTTAAFTLHPVSDGHVTPNTQVNEAEARALVDHLKEILGRPEYDGATIGVIALFDEQADYIQELVATEIPLDALTERGVVVAIADGWQGDERDVILYSLSYDADGMTQAQLSPRMMDFTHIQGLLNVMFTRARDEIHIFHSADPTQFTFAGGRASVLSDWLAHAARVAQRGRVFRGESRVGRVDSDFELQVADRLQRSGFLVTHQYPASGFWIDLVVEDSAAPGLRLAVECDGEPWHSDEHGRLPVNDLEREAVLERAGWSILRIPYRNWRRSPEAQVDRVAQWFREHGGSDDAADGESGAQTPGGDAASQGKRGRPQARSVQGATESHIVAAVREGTHNEAEAVRKVSRQLGYQRVGSRIAAHILGERNRLVRAGILVVEDGEWFLTPAGRAANVPARAATGRGAPTCVCGSPMILRSGRYGAFYSCRRYPACKRTRSA